ncbi:SGNH/GDSL hydrolase family protein [Pectinatus frisingensis]|uniref:SGNH/GDSL hydrolase family protein n=1 Tax=Pectinatus frisingensis TaxID=865 RepID=UPI0015F5EC94|nr:GDSL-type esterase/lipase family protein [Pectinatus frisingensis]
MKYTIFFLVLSIIAVLSGDAYSFRQLYPAPEISTHYTQAVPASDAPLLAWNKNTQAVYYELEVFNKIPTDLKINAPSPEHVYFTNQVFINAFNLDLKNLDHDVPTTLYWRVRAMDIDNRPITNFSSMEVLYTDNHPTKINSPIPDADYDSGNGSILLYPVYQWIPNAGASKFEIEILSSPPETDNTDSSQPVYSHTIDFACEYYDPFPRIGTYYWRVRGLDDSGQPVGDYSQTEKFSNDPAAHYNVGIFGDSISHGGGHMSYSPADFEFSYAHYLNFPTINLSESGDTIERMVNRFDKDVLPFAPKYLIIMGASNSLRAGVPADKIIVGLKMLQQKCYQNNITPVLLTLPPINPINIKKIFNEGTASGWADEFNKVNAYIRTQLYIDTAADFPTPPDVLPTEYALDGLHLDDNGKEIMGRTINANWQRIIETAAENDGSVDVDISDDELKMFYDTPDVH